LRQLAEYISGPKVIYTSRDKVDEIRDQAKLLGATLVSADPNEMTNHVMSLLLPPWNKALHPRFSSPPEQAPLPTEESGPEQRQESRPRGPLKKAVRKVAMPKKRK
jgi:hypothetical protein